MGFIREGGKMKSLTPKLDKIGEREFNPCISIKEIKEIGVIEKSVIKEILDKYGKSNKRITMHKEFQRGVDSVLYVLEIDLLGEEK